MLLFLTSCLLALPLQGEAPAKPSEWVKEVPVAEVPVAGTQEPGKKEEGKQSGSEQQSDRKRGSGRPRMSREEAQRWWEGLSEQEKQKARERMQRFREMKPEAQKELARRTELLRTVGKEVFAEMSAEQRASYDKLPEEERVRVHQALVRKKLAECGENIEGWNAPSSDRPLEDRLRHSQEQRDEWRKKRTERDLGRAVEEGWISKKAAEQLRKGSSEALSAQLDQVRQWRMIEWFDKEAVWEKMGIDASERERIIGLDPKLFLEEMRKHSSALRGPGERGDRGGRRNGGRRQDGPPREGEDAATEKPRGDGNGNGGGSRHRF